MVVTYFVWFDFPNIFAEVFICIKRNNVEVASVIFSTIV